VLRCLNITVAAVALISSWSPGVALAQEDIIPDNLQTVVVEMTEVETLLGQIAQAGVPEEFAQRAFNDLVSLGPASTPELIAIYQDLGESEHRRWVSARALGHIGGDKAVEALLTGMRSNDFMTRIGATSALGILQGDQARMALEEALFDPAMEVRCTAADGLAEMGHQASSLSLARAVNTPDNFHRGASLPSRSHMVLALGRTGGETAIEALIGVLDDRNPSLRALTVKALEEATGANPNQSYGNGVTATDAEVQGWKDWWSRHASAKPGE